MKKLLNDLDKMHHAMEADSLLFGIVIGSIGTLLLLALGHNLTNRKNNE